MAASTVGVAHSTSSAGRGGVFIGVAIAVFISDAAGGRSAGVRARLVFFFSSPLPPQALHKEKVKKRAGRGWIFFQPLT